MNKLEGFFEDIFCINLARRMDRYIQATAEFEKHNLEVKFIEGIDGKTLPVRYILSKDGMQVSRGDLGCTLSHLKVTKLAKERKLKSYLVFEDDVELDPNFNELLLKYLEYIPSDWDMIYFGGNHNKPLVKINEHISKMTQTFTTHAMIVKDTVYDKMIEMWSKENEKVDVALSELHRDNNCYVFTPHIAFQRPSFSDILNIETDYKHLRNK